MPSVLDLETGPSDLDLSAEGPSIFLDASALDLSRGT